MSSSFTFQKYVTAVSKHNPMIRYIWEVEDSVSDEGKGHALHYRNLTPSTPTRYKLGGNQPFWIWLCTETFQMHLLRIQPQSHTSNLPL